MATANMNITKTDCSTLSLTEAEEKQVISFLHEHLEEYGDSPEDIGKCLNYAMGKNGAPGGLLVTSWDNERLVGVVITNKTGMNGYIPENILVYIATHKDYRGKGVGKKLMKEAIERSSGDIALHVEPENPAKRLYESLGFTNKYLEMRLKRS